MAPEETRTAAAGPVLMDLARAHAYGRDMQDQMQDYRQRWMDAEQRLARAEGERDVLRARCERLQQQVLQ